MIGLTKKGHATGGTGGVCLSRGFPQGAKRERPASHRPDRNPPTSTNTATGRYHPGKHPERPIMRPVPHDHAVTLSQDIRAGPARKPAAPLVAGVAGASSTRCPSGVRMNRHRVTAGRPAWSQRW